MGSKTFCTLVFINQGIEYRSSVIMLQLHKMSVRPYLEYCVQFGHLVMGNVTKLESVQPKLMLTESEGLREMLDRLGFYSLKCSRVRDGLIGLYKIMRGIDFVIVLG